MQFGDGIQIQEPQRLLDRIKQVGLAWAGKPVPSNSNKPPTRTSKSPKSANQNCEFVHLEGRTPEIKRNFTQSAKEASRKTHFCKYFHDDEKFDVFVV